MPWWFFAGSHGRRCDTCFRDINLWITENKRAGEI